MPPCQLLCDQLRCDDGHRLPKYSGGPISSILAIKWGNSWNKLTDFDAVFLIAAAVFATPAHRAKSSLRRCPSTRGCVAGEDRIDFKALTTLGLRYLGWCTASTKARPQSGFRSGFRSACSDLNMWFF